jgi:N-acetyl-gamma-glutamyl-phosphate reductase
MVVAKSIEPIRVGVLGARGHVGVELLRLLDGHPCFDVSYISSRTLAGRKLSDVSDLKSSLCFENLGPAEAAARHVDVVVLALPNNVSTRFVTAIEERGEPPKMIDLSADHRFSSAWAYGLPELNRQNVCGSNRVANPGCYATAAQLGLEPLVKLLERPPAIFGVSGYSGAGTSKSEKNDPNTLRDNLLAYRLVDHVHEREVSHRLQHAVHFMPHVASFFRGIHLTINLELKQAMAGDKVLEMYQQRYADEALVHVVDGEPRVRDAVGSHAAFIGQVGSHGKRAVVTVTIDNLLKGAASQALQNMNLMFDCDELLGLAHGP